VRYPALNVHHWGSIEPQYMREKRSPRGWLFVGTSGRQKNLLNDFSEFSSLAPVYIRGLDWWSGLPASKTR